LIIDPRTACLHLTPARTRTAARGIRWDAPSERTRARAHARTRLNAPRRGMHRYGTIASTRNARNAHLSLALPHAHAHLACARLRAAAVYGAAGFDQIRGTYRYVLPRMNCQCCTFRPHCAVARVRRDDQIKERVPAHALRAYPRL
jgi:hypothetical protein